MGSDVDRLPFLVVTAVDGTDAFCLRVAAMFAVAQENADGLMELESPGLIQQIEQSRIE
jgi:hypothetical protein